MATRLAENPDDDDGVTICPQSLFTCECVHQRGTFKLFNRVRLRPAHRFHDFRALPLSYRALHLCIMHYAYPACLLNEVDISSIQSSEIRSGSRPNKSVGAIDRF